MMTDDARKQYDDAVDLMRELHLRGDPSAEDRTLFRMVRALDAMVTMLRVRVDELEVAAREAGAGENTVDRKALEAAERDDPAKAWSPEDEAAHRAELPPTLPHQP